MGDVDRRPGRRGRSPAWTAIRWMVLSAVIAGLFGMHVLTDGDNASSHGDLAPVNVAAQSSSGNDVMTGIPRDLQTTFDSGTALNTSSGPVVSAAPSDPMGAGHGMAQCVLFLVTVGSALLLALLASRWPARTGGLVAAVTAIWGELRRRGPPGPERPRIALCVTRISSSPPRAVPSQDCADSSLPSSIRFHVQRSTLNEHVHPSCRGRGSRDPDAFPGRV